MRATWCCSLRRPPCCFRCVNREQLLTHPEGHKNAEGVWINELHLHVSAARTHKHALIIMYK